MPLINNPEPACLQQKCTVWVILFVFMGKCSAQPGLLITRNVAFCVKVLETRRLQNLSANNKWAFWQQQHIQLCVSNTDIPICVYVVKYPAWQCFRHTDYTECYGNQEQHTWFSSMKMKERNDEWLWRKDAEDIRFMNEIPCTSTRPVIIAVTE
jgi:hypothetical protein